MFFHSVVWYQISFVLVLYGQRIDTHLTDPPLGTDRGSRWCSTIAPTRRSSSTLLEEEAVDRYPYVWVRTDKELAPRWFSSQNFYVPGVKLRYTGIEPRTSRSGEVDLSPTL